MKKIILSILILAFCTQSSCLALNHKKGENKPMGKIVQTASRDNLEKKVRKNKTPALSEKDKYAQTIFFPIGEPNNAYAKYFVGQSYLAPVSVEQVKIYNVTFEPKCRNNWHIHTATKGGGQMLIAVGGRGYYQEWSKEPIEMKPGDVINIPANVKHWHGAAPDSWFSHLAIEIDGTETSNKWLEAVSDEDYNRLK